MQLQLRKIWHLEQTIEFEVPMPDEEETLRLRVEVFALMGAEDQGSFLARVFRYDLFRLSLIPVGNQPADFASGTDHELLIVDPVFDKLEVQAGSSDRAIEIVIDRILDQLGRS